MSIPSSFIIQKEYTISTNDLVLKWFDDSFPNFINRDIITDDADYDILLKNTKRCFIELLYTKLQVIKKLEIILLKENCLIELGISCQKIL